jgi:hypothetical protein
MKAVQCERGNKYKNWSRMDHKSNYFWTNSINYRENTGKDEDLSFNNFDNNRAFTFNNFRLNDGNDNSNDFEFSSNFIKNFNDKGIN